MSNQVVHTFSLFWWKLLSRNYALKDLSQTAFPLKGVFVVNGIQFCSMPGFFEEAPVLAPDEAQRAIDLKEYAKIQYNDI